MGNLDHEAEVGLDHLRPCLLVALLDTRRQAYLILGSQQSNLPDLAQIDLDPILTFSIAVDYHVPLTLKIPGRFGLPQNYALTLRYARTFSPGTQSHYLLTTLDGQTRYLVQSSSRA